MDTYIYIDSEEARDKYGPKLATDEVLSGSNQWCPIIDDNGVFNKALRYRRRVNSPETQKRMVEEVLATDLLPLAQSEIARLNRAVDYWKDQWKGQCVEYDKLALLLSGLTAQGVATANHLRVAHDYLNQFTMSRNLCAPLHALADVLDRVTKRNHEPK
jgi:hypothetical protein